MGINIMAGKGSGKSRLMGRCIAWQDFVRGVPLVILDPVGGTIDNFLDKIVRLPEAWQRQAWERIIYVEPSGTSGSIVPFPLYYRLGNESLYTISQRYLDVLRKLDPHLQSASIMGWNALHKTGTMTGMILSALGGQITEVPHLLKHPESWLAQTMARIPDFPELKEVSDSLATYSRLREFDKAKERDSFLNKTTLFCLEPAMTAMFGAAAPGFTWQDVIGQGKAVLFDLRHVLDIERKRFLTWWFYSYFLSYIKARGHGRHTPVSFIIDELTTLLNFGALESDSFVEELDALINVVARSHRVWLTIALQEAWQVSENIIKALMTMGTQIVGTTSDPETAKRLASYFYEYEPTWVRKRQNVYMNMPVGRYMNEIQTIDEHTTEFSVDEQLTLQSYTISKQGLFQFLVRPAFAEGDIQGQMRWMSIENIDKGIWVAEDVVQEARRRLSLACGIPIEQTLEQIRQRVAGEGGYKLPASQTPHQPDILHPNNEDHTVSLPTEQTTSQESATSAAATDNFWR